MQFPLKKTFGHLAALLLFASFGNLSTAQKIERVEPPSWFTGMKETAVQLMVYGQEIGII